VSKPELSAFRHRNTYDDVAGRDRWTVRLVGGWIVSALPGWLAAAAPGPVLDVGCGEQPFRRLIEALGRAYVGMDVAQNSTQSVDVIGTLETVPAPDRGYPIVLCTEVLEHVHDVDAAFDGLRRLVAPSGLVVLTVPFIFPLHMEPHDFRRLTPHGIARLAVEHGFEVQSMTQLGSVAEAVATLVADASILPATRSAYARVKARVLRMASARLVSFLESASLSRHVTINSHSYLSNGVVLRAG
jgi:2-polyprenyl-3-methyl-5-hydroxy-6-metoxy-1,4-benzoquinol methylase